MLYIAMVSFELCLLLGCIACTQCDAGYCYRRSSMVCVSVCLLVMFVSPAKMGEPIEMPFLEDDS